MKQTIVVKNSLWVRSILRSVYHYVGFEGGINVSCSLDSDEYLVVLPLDKKRIDSVYTYMSCDKDYFERYLKDNPYCLHFERVVDFINEMNNRNGI